MGAQMKHGSVQQSRDNIEDAQMKVDFDKHFRVPNKDGIETAERTEEQKLAAAAEPVSAAAAAAKALDAKLVDRRAIEATFVAGREVEKQEEKNLEKPAVVPAQAVAAAE